MKKTITLLCLMFFLTLSAAGNQYTLQVTLSQTAQTVNFMVRKTLKNNAQKTAVRLYIKRLAPQIQEILIEKATNEYSNFIESIEKISEEQTALGGDAVAVKCDFRVTLRHDRINNFLRENGFTISKGFEIIVLEEPLGQIQLHESLKEGNYFISNYTTIQRRVRDMIIKKVSSFGFDVKLLVDNDLYRSNLTQDNTLSGVYYDAESQKFRANRKLLNLVKANNPNTIVLYYRLDALIYSPSTRALRATISFSLKDLEKNVTKALGSNSFELIASGTGKAVLMDEIAYCAETAVSILLGEEGAADRLNRLAMSIRNSAEIDRKTLKIVINASAFESKNRKKIMYFLRKELIARKIIESGSLKTTNTSLYAAVKNPAITSVDQLYMEYIVPILEKYGATPDDNKVNYDNNTLTISH